MVRSGVAGCGGSGDGGGGGAVCRSDLTCGSAGWGLRFRPKAVAGAFEAARAAMVNPVVVAANRVRLCSWCCRMFGQNAPAIAFAEATYEQMWAAITMVGLSTVRHQQRRRRWRHGSRCQACRGLLGGAANAPAAATGRCAEASPS